MATKTLSPFLSGIMAQLSDGCRRDEAESGSCATAIEAPLPMALGVRGTVRRARLLCYTELKALLQESRNLLYQVTWSGALSFVNPSHTSWA